MNIFISVRNAKWAEYLYLARWSHHR